MAQKPPTKLNFKLGDVMRAAFGLAMVDGGFIIAIQIITFLLNYFGASIQFGEQETTGIVTISKSTFIIAVLGMLNLSVIIYRVTGLSRGLKYSANICYQQAVRRWPLLILLYMLGSALILAITLPIVQLLTNLITIPAFNLKNLLTFSILLLYPYGILACIFVIDQGKNPFQALVATYNIIKQKISMGLLLNVSMLYALPLSLTAHLGTSRFANYIDLVNSLWFLFCHILVIVIYAGANVATKMEEQKDKTTKVIVV